MNAKVTGIVGFARRNGVSERGLVALRTYLSAVQRGLSSTDAVFVTRGMLGVSQQLVEFYLGGAYRAVVTNDFARMTLSGLSTLTTGYIVAK